MPCRKTNDCSHFIRKELDLKSCPVGAEVPRRVLLLHGVRRRLDVLRATKVETGAQLEYQKIGEMLLSKSGK